MNAGQRNYILSEIDRIIKGKLSTLSAIDKAQEELYQESTKVTFQDLMANNRALLTSLPVNPDTKAHTEVKVLNSVFDFTDHKLKLANAAGTIQPDVVPGRPDKLKSVGYRSEGENYNSRSYNFFYLEFYNKAKVLLAQAKVAKREAILSNNATALKILEDLEAE